jgi:hypothetical protein
MLSRRFNRYLQDFRRFVRQLGPAAGLLVMLVSLPGIIVPAMPDEWTRAVSWLPPALAGVSSLLFVVGLGLLWHWLRRAWRFGPRLALRSRPRR